MELGDGMRVVAPDPGGSAQQLRITVRPEKIRFGDGSNGAGSQIRGRVIERIYLGSLSQTVVEIATGERLVVHELNDDEAVTAAPGDEVTLSWAERHSLVVESGEPQPEQG